MATLYEKYIAGDDHVGNVYGVNWDGQTFTPSINHIITSVKLKLYRVLSPGTITVSIRATTSSLPSGADLCSGTTDGDTLTDSSPGEWREITLGAGALLLASTEYAICVRVLSGDSSNHVNWRRDDSSPTYASGQRAYSSDSGVGWTAASTDDMMFEEWGEPQGTAGGGGGSIYPSAAITRVTNLIHRYDRRQGIYQLECSFGDTTSVVSLPYTGAPLRATVDKQAEETARVLEPEIAEKVRNYVPPTYIKKEQPATIPLPRTVPSAYTGPRVYTPPPKPVWQPPTAERIAAYKPPSFIKLEVLPGEKTGAYESAADKAKRLADEAARRKRLSQLMPGL